MDKGLRKLVIAIAFSLGVVVGGAIALLLLRARRASGGELLERFEHEMRALESERSRLGGDLAAQVTRLASEQAALRAQTSGLAEALRRPAVRGQWGEATLRNVVEAAGLSGHCDFATQVHLAGEDGAARPDLIVRLPGGGAIAVDAKAPLDAYLDAATTSDERAATACLDAFVGNLRSRVKELAAKRYWQRLSRSPDIVVMFVPSEAAFSAALLRDDRLLDDAARQRVVLATPCTMIALLHVVALAWREDTLAEHAGRVRELGAELCTRLTVVASKLAATSKGLESAVRAHNDAVGSYESRLLVTARRMSDLGISEGDVETPRLASEVVRHPRGLDTPAA